MKTTSAIVRFTPKSLKRIKEIQDKLRLLKKKANKSEAANYIIENS